MKKYIKSVAEVTDLFSAFDTIIVVPDVRNTELGPAEDDRDELENKTDDEIKDLTDVQIDAIYHPNAIIRMSKVIPERLDRYRLIYANLKDSLAQKRSLTDAEINRVLSRLKQCKNVQFVRIGALSKTDSFIQRFGITNQDVLNMISTLNLSNFDNATNSFSYENFGNDLIVFIIRDEFKLLNGRVISGISIYMKIDYTATSADGKTAAIMSIHAADEAKLAEREKMRKRGEHYPMGHIHRD